jgi:hypothetical protein
MQKRSRPINFPKTTLVVADTCCCDDIIAIFLTISRLLHDIFSIRSCHHVTTQHGPQLPVFNILTDQ